MERKYLDFKSKIKMIGAIHDSDALINGIVKPDAGRQRWAGRSGYEGAQLF